ncbi:hypothetical protein J4433_03005 [Candidatus Pacearchaeota archaeon]|nr:hypothetical protein [Candidatus Pacearchaeota archaeon]
MKKLRKCPACSRYTLKDSCDKCHAKTEPAGQKFIRKNLQ